MNFAASTTDKIDDVATDAAGNSVTSARTMVVEASLS
jgi:hypothetical protein